MEKKNLMYEGKAKQVYATDEADKVIIHYKDAATAGNGAKKADIDNKGVLNNKITSIIFRKLNESGVPTHYIETLNEREQLVITLYYYEKLRFSDIGRVLEVSESRVCQLHSLAVRKMKEFMQDYLNN